MALVRATADSLRLTLGPGFGACFPKDMKARVDEIGFDTRTLDRKSGRYESVTLALTRKEHIKGACKAIDTIMKSAARND